MNDKVLGGDVSAQFTYSAESDHAKALEACRKEQEEMCGYALNTKAMRQTHTINDKGVDVYEVFVTFAPVPAPVGPVK